MARSPIKLENTGRLYAALTKHGNAVRKQTRRKVIVGFEAPYAAAVHEKVDMKLKGLPRRSGIGVYWGPHGQAKFLEEPARRLRPQIAKRIATVTKNTHSFERGLYSGAVLLRNAAQYLVPVEYGTLKNSAFIEIV